MSVEKLVPPRQECEELTAIFAHHPQTSKDFLIFPLSFFLCMPPAAPFVRQVGAALGVSAFVLAATVGGFRMGVLVMIAFSAGTFACILALPAHSPNEARG